MCGSPVWCFKSGNNKGVCMWWIGADKRARPADTKKTRHCIRAMHISLSRRIKRSLIPNLTPIRDSAARRDITFIQCTMHGIRESAALHPWSIFLNKTFGLSLSCSKEIDGAKREGRAPGHFYFGVMRIYNERATKCISLFTESADQVAPHKKERVMPTSL